MGSARRPRRDSGLALRGLAHPGNRGAGHHEQLDVEHRIHDRPDAAAKAAQATGREPDAEMGVPPGPGVGSVAVSRTRGGSPVAIRCVCLWDAGPRPDRACRARRADRSAGVRIDRSAGRQSGADA